MAAFFAVLCARLRLAIGSVFVSLDFFFVLRGPSRGKKTKALSHARGSVFFFHHLFPVPLLHRKEESNEKGKKRGRVCD